MVGADIGRPHEERGRDVVELLERAVQEIGEVEGEAESIRRSPSGPSDVGGQAFGNLGVSDRYLDVTYDSAGRRNRKEDKGTRCSDPRPSWRVITEPP